jgi:hypothetical protein
LRIEERELEAGGLNSSKKKGASWDRARVAYMLRVTQTRAHRLIVLASDEGTTASGSVSTTLRVVPGKRVRSVQLRLSGSDPSGNAGCRSPGR